MPLTVVTLKPYTYLTLEDVKDWLNIDLTVTKYDNRINRLINTATDMVEKHIDGPVLTRQFVETRDGNSSNVITLDYNPIRSLDEVRIDYNHQFPDSTIVQPQNAILRGQPDIAQAYNSPSIQIMGQDIVLRDDNNTAILGRIFAGSVIQSIQVKYHAGWGDSQATMPADLVQATLMLIEYLYMLRDNRDMNIKSKTNTGQSYSREAGIPKEIEMILDTYKDYAFGHSNVPQKNTFTI